MTYFLHIKDGNSPIIIHYRVIFLWIYKPIHRTDAFIANGGDVEYPKKEHSKWHGGRCCFGLYISKKKNGN